MKVVTVEAPKMSNFTEEELNKLTVVKLKELAKERKIHVPSKSRKDEIVAIIFRELQKDEDKEEDDSKPDDYYYGEFPKDVTREQATKILAKGLVKYKEEKAPHMTKEQAVNILDWWCEHDHDNHFDHLFDSDDEGCFDEIISLALGTTNFTEEELKKLTVAKLKELAKERNIPVPANSRKEEIVAIILEYEDEGIGDDSGEADCFSDDFPEDVTRKQAVEILAKMLAKYKEENKPNMTKKQALEHLEWWRGRDHFSHFAHLFRDEGCFDEVISLVFDKDFTKEDLKKLTVVKLKELAKERKISIPTKSRKDEIIAIILKDNPVSKDDTPEIKGERAGKETLLVQLKEDYEEDFKYYRIVRNISKIKSLLTDIRSSGLIAHLEYPSEFPSKVEVRGYDGMKNLLAFHILGL